MTHRSRFPVLVAAVLLAGCAAPASRATHAPPPVACTDSLYLQLARQHPDSLSERAWTRLQSLDSACARARTRPENDTRGMGMMGMGHGGSRAWTILAPVIVASMAAMMIVFRF